MELPNIQTFRHSELPPLDDAMKGEIAEIDFNVSNLLLKLQGNYRALCVLHETLSDLLDSCDMNISCIRIIPDGDEGEGALRAISLNDLPIEEKNIFVSVGISSTVAIEMLADALDCDFEDAAFQVRVISQGRCKAMSQQQIEQVLEQLAEKLRDNPKEGVFLTQV